MERIISELNQEKIFFASDAGKSLTSKDKIIDEKDISIKVKEQNIAKQERKIKELESQLLAKVIHPLPATRPVPRTKTYATKRRKPPTGKEIKGLHLAKRSKRVIFEDEHEVEKAKGKGEAVGEAPVKVQEGHVPSTDVAATSSSNENLSTLTQLKSKILKV